MKLRIILQILVEVLTPEFLQNGIDLVHGLLNQILPTYGHHEVLILYSALSTCDPGDVMEAIQKCKNSKIRCLVIVLSAEIYICKCLCQETGGSYYVALDEPHLKELILEHAPPPPSIAEFAIPNLIKMGFPQRAAGVISICSCHKDAKSGGGYICPRWRARICELPSECRICGLTLVSSPHLARSYHHLFPMAPFDDVSPLMSNDPRKLPENCFGCQQSLLNPGRWRCIWTFYNASLWSGCRIKCFFEFLKLQILKFRFYFNVSI